MNVEPRRLLGYALAASLVAILAVPFLRAVPRSAKRDRDSSSPCMALEPAGGNAALRVPAAAPPLSAPDFTEARRTLEAYRGQVVLLNFWATWCAPCVEEMPALEALQTRLAGKPFAVVAVASAPSWEGIRKFFAKGTNLTVLLDPTAEDGDVGAITRSWGTRKLPETYLIDKEGNVRYYFVSTRDWSSRTAVACMEYLLRE